jgi:hypothetical protein
MQYRKTIPEDSIQSNNLSDSSKRKSSESQNCSYQKDFTLIPAVRLKIAKSY